MSAIVLELQYGFSWKSTLPSSHTDCFIRKKLGLGALRPASEESQGKLVCVSPGMCSVDGFPGSSSMHVRMLFPVVGPGMPELKADGLKDEMKQSFSALFDTLLTSPSKEKRPLLLPLPKLYASPGDSNIVPGNVCGCFRRSYKVCTSSTDAAKDSMSIFAQNLGIDCVYVCDPSPNPKVTFEKLMDVAQLVPVCGTVMDAVSLDREVHSQSKAV